ncbi:beta-galactosidase [Fibrella forsythiae]|uniref:Beta-galactosidase n=1 Tax=Fibrella forsythiae TaxID=2817061 RepID=A0ABS3JDB0_9BACT|nr:beta-galactosidase [Fibrella forsythiae]MBO0947249.1 beta-galactosidase [Fibrella forsythiae]
MANRGFAFYLGVDGSPVPATVLTPGVFVVLEDYPGEPEEDALERVRLGLGTRLTVSQLRNVIALPTGRPLVNLIATAVSASKINIGWKRFALAFSYEVHRSTDNVTFTPWQIVPQVGLNDPAISDTGRVQGTIYYYKARARNSLGIAISEWTMTSATTLVGLEAIQGTTTTTPLAGLEGLAYNATVGLDVINLLVNFSEPIEIQASKNGELITGTILAGNAGKFNLATDTWLGYDGRIRFDRAVAGQGGIQVGDVITLKFRAQSNRLINYVYTWTVEDVTNTSPVVLPLTGTGGNNTDQAQVFAGPLTFTVTIPDQQVARPQSIGTTALNYDVGSTTHTGFPFFDAVDGTPEPSLSASNVYFVDRGGSETIAATLGRVRAGGVTKYLKSAVTNVRPITDQFIDHNLSGTRSGGLRMYLQNPDPVTGKIASFDEEMLRHSKAEGCNFAYIHVAQGWVERTAIGTYDWRLLLSALALMRELGMRVFLHVDGSRSENNNTQSSGEPFIPDSEQMRDQGGNLLRGGGNRIASYESTLMQQRFDTFVTDVLNEVKEAGYADLVAVTATSICTQFEAEYTTRNTVGSQEQLPAKYDFSAPSLAKFKQRVQTKYTAKAAQDGVTPIASLNSAWGTNYSNFTEVAFPSMGATEGFFNQWQFDFFNHRQLSIVEFENRQHALIKAISPNIKTVAEFGSLYAQAEQRGAIALANLLQTDGVKQNDDIPSPLRRSIALSMRDYASNRFCGTEMDCSQGNNNDRQNQLITFFREGGHYFNLFSFYTADPRNGPDVVAASKTKLTELLTGVFAQTPLNVPVVNSYQATITISGKRLARDSWAAGSVQPFTEFDTATANGTKRVRVNITQDF